ncbi:hypothetical protein JMJ77_0012540 [Colletotrichum scovillei]|uniref:Uncharacterized protein n=1 Tax=Colletotrichum scovillei TaxID=1209932 RepID=A0A9P7R3Y7_9PEZI|nr:hypothetical protein JMJ77_0012540 [Colletotrichum scovillei]KAG7068818.1 hypothetical protein JMJ76_0002498 [Colletotrichum scovillei]KAG7072774.1 hypothetical protein JMJ78_0013759 [Colletotrichum scovillei]
MLISIEPSFVSVLTEFTTERETLAAAIKHEGCDSEAIVTGDLPFLPLEFWPRVAPVIYPTLSVPCAWIEICTWRGRLQAQAGTFYRTSTAASYTFHCNLSIGQRAYSYRSADHPILPSGEMRERNQ